VVITNFDFNVFASEPFWRVFNQMLQRLLSGRFDMDLNVIGGEGYLHNGQLEDSLRHEIESYIEGRLGAIKQEIASLQSQLNESLTRLLDRQGDVQMDGSMTASIAEHLRASHERGVELAASESSRAKASSTRTAIMSRSRTARPRPNSAASASS